MTFDEIVEPIRAGSKTTEAVFTGKKYARHAWPDGDYLGIVPNVSNPARPTLAILRDEPYAAVSRSWDAADEDRKADDWHVILPDDGVA